jgi:MFS family permease/GNAT superfamily N-acetyltransferase
MSDRLGRRALMVSGSAGETVSLVVLALADSVAAYAVGAFLVGLSRAVLEAPGKALIADHAPDRDTRELAHHARYFLINVGGAVGPLVGLGLGLSARQAAFWLAALVYGAFTLVLMRAFRRAPDVVPAPGRAQATIRAAVAVLRRDHRFLLLLAAIFLSMVAYAQQETTVIQYLNLAGGGGAVRLVTALLVTNAVTIVLFQFPMLRLLRRHDLYVRTYMGVALFVTAFAAYAVLPATGVGGWIAATWVLSLGEAILFPTLNVQIDRLAPDGFKGSYLGAAGLASLGLGVGPAIGGVLLDRLGGTAAFMSMAATECAGAGCYWGSSRVAGPASERTDAPEAPVAVTAYEISTDPSRLDVDLVHSVLTASYWARGRPREVVARSIAHSICFGAYVDGRLVGFARVVSDRAVFAYLMDVFVVPEHRGQGMGRALVQAAVGHPELQGLRLFTLRTRDAHRLYSRVGFEAMSHPERAMAIVRPEVP